MESYRFICILWISTILNAMKLYRRTFRLPGKTFFPAPLLHPPPPPPIDTVIDETTRRRITVTSSLNEISTNQLGNKVVVWGGGTLPFYSSLLNWYTKTTWTVFPPRRIFASWIEDIKNGSFNWFSFCCLGKDDVKKYLLFNLPRIELRLKRIPLFKKVEGKMWASCP